MATCPSVTSTEDSPARTRSTSPIRRTTVARRSRPRDRAAIRRTPRCVRTEPSTSRGPSPPSASTTRRASSKATGSYSLMVDLARVKSTVPSERTAASCGLGAHLYATTIVMPGLLRWIRRGSGSSPVFPEDLSAGDVHHDLVRAATEAVTAQVTPEAGDPGLGVDADAAEDLHGFVGDLEGGHRHVSLAQRALTAQRDPLVDHPRGLVDEVAHVLELDRHVGQLELDQLERADRLAELHPLRRVGCRVVERALGKAEAGGRDDQALEVEVAHQLPEAVAPDTHEAGVGDCDVVKEDLARVVGVPDDLLERVGGDTGGVHRHQVHRDGVP